MESETNQTELFSAQALSFYTKTGFRPVYWASGGVINPASGFERSANGRFGSRTPDRCPTLNDCKQYEAASRVMRCDRQLPTNN